MPLSKTSKVDLRKQDEVPLEATLCNNNNIKAFCPVTDFSDCQFLTSIPDLSKNSHLKDKTHLVEVHHSIGLLDELVPFNLNQCNSLRNLPRRLKLRSLKSLDLEGCSSLQSVLEFDCSMETLEYINLSYSAFKEISPSIRHFTGLWVLYLGGRQNFLHISNYILQLQQMKTLSLELEYERRWRVKDSAVCILLCLQMNMKLHQVENHSRCHI
ncbi:hypothetical protein I3760_15G138900 [Carya illinoinensis]|nr:hypothetical protein I3760_15G138900 [Carya illinoinensis]